MKIKQPMEIYQWGLCVWNDATSNFESLRVVWEKSKSSPVPPAIPNGHPIRWKDAARQDFILFGNPMPTLGCRATFESWQDSSKWLKYKPVEYLLSAADRKPIKLHSGHVAFNPWRKRWIVIFMESFGKPSGFGELWYAEARTPSGPWGKAVKILSHENYTFYNPRIHPEFTALDSPILIFEGTYTQQFADRAQPTARYDYNQMLYRLDLDDPALKPAQTE
jgi:hypothetical protein